MNTTAEQPIKVLIVEDSNTQRWLLERIINEHPRLSVVGAVTSGEAALSALKRLCPDVITMDICLPGMDGIETTKEIMRLRPTRIVVVANDAPSQGRSAFNALKAGALSIVEKPKGPASDSFPQIADRLCRQIVAMSSLKLVRRRGGEAAQTAERIVADASPPVSFDPSRSPIRMGSVEAVCIGASTGGPTAILEVLKGLGPEFPAPIFIVQHITASFCDSFISWLNDAAPMPVVAATHNAAPERGVAYVAPPERHLEIRKGLMTLTRGPLVSAQRPAVTVLFQSVAEDLGAASLGVLLTGMGDDGALGLLEMKRAGAHTIAEDKSSAVVYGMPCAAVEMDAACETAPLSTIAARLRQLVTPKLSVA